MKAPVVAAAASLSILTAMLSGCSTAESTPTPTQTAAASQSGPDPAALRQSLADIDPALDEDGSVDDAGSVCLDIQAGKDDPTVEANARKLFDKRVDGLTDDQVAKIVEAVKTHFCR
jgi:hypothetical protein